MKTFKKNTASKSARRDLLLQLHEAELAMRSEWRPLSNGSHVERKRPLIGIQAALKRHRERMRDLARPMRPYDPSGLFKSQTGKRKNKQSIDKARSHFPYLPEADLRAIQLKIEKDFIEDVDGRITRFVHAFIEQVSGGQGKEPISMNSVFYRRLAASFCSAVRNALSAYAADVIRSLRHRRDIGQKQLQALMKHVNGIIDSQTSNRVARALVGEISSYLRIDNYNGAATRALTRALDCLSMPVKNKVAEDIKWNLAITGSARSKYDATPAQKIADPEQFPKMKISEVMEVLGRSRSSVNRYIEDGKLRRTQLAGTVTTASVAALFTEND